MIVIADTSPLNYLILIEHVEVLAPLYTRIVVPETVTRELRREPAPAIVKAWIARPPEWLEVRPDPPWDSTLQFLDPGEGAALALAEFLKADEVIIDDWAGRAEAQRRHLRLTGTLGVLAEAHLKGLLDFETALTRLRTTNFRLSAEVERLARRRLSAR